MCSIRLKVTLIHYHINLKFSFATLLVKLPAGKSFTYHSEQQLQGTQLEEKELLRDKKHIGKLTRRFLKRKGGY